MRVIWRSMGRWTLLDSARRHFLLRCMRKESRYCPSIREEISRWRIVDNLQEQTRPSDIMVKRNSSRREKLNSMNLLLHMSPIAVLVLLPTTLSMEPTVSDVTLSLGRSAIGSCGHFF
ncbi:uncharacterized protein LOC143887507 isoform X2 [Tasmannia lanceolata]|uniref:uncharacterized protein LOC143887507 isoform X2 n=1 Tax=Tasmannia lanceolata TaxID=3420 RepID=UPI0040634C35